MTTLLAVFRLFGQSPFNLFHREVCERHVRFIPGWEPVDTLM
jgi:hypothetical protein